MDDDDSDSDPMQRAPPARLAASSRASAQVTNALEHQQGHREQAHAGDDEFSLDAGGGERRIRSDPDGRRGGAVGISVGGSHRFYGG